LLGDVGAFLAYISLRLIGGKMRIKIASIIMLSLIAFLSIVSHAGQELLADLFRSGQVRFIPDLTLNDSTLPEDVYFQGYEHPWAISCDKQGNIYIADYAANHIKKFDSSGKYIGVIGRRGQGPEEFNMPYILTISKDRLVVWDMGNRRFSIMTTDGKHIKSRTLNRVEEGWPWKMRTLPNGDILLESEKLNRENINNPQIREIRLYTPEMEYKKTLYSQEVQSDKYLTNPRRNIPVPFAPRLLWDMAPDGKVVIGYSDEYKFDVYDSEKEKLFSFTHDGQRVKVTKKDKELWFKGITHSQGGVVTEGAPDYVIKNTEFPKFKPVFKQVMIDSDGNILVSTHRKDQEEEYKFFDAFDSLGRFINSVKVLEGEYPPLGARIFKGSFFVRAPDEEELIKIVKYRISK
jgi:hypothetical protein